MVAEKGIVHIINETLTSFRKNKFDAVFVDSRQEALHIVLKRILHGAVVGAGDSATSKEIGVFDELKRRGFRVYWPFDEEVLKKEEILLGKLCWQMCFCPVQTP